MANTPDADLIERTLERISEAAGDITPRVYRTFFDRRPDAKSYFTSEHSMALGHMLTDVFMTLIDEANRGDYVPVLVESTLADHDAKGVKDASLYTDFMASLRDTVTEVLEDDWPEAERRCFFSQCDRMLLRFTAA